MKVSQKYLPFGRWNSYLLMDIAVLIFCFLLADKPRLALYAKRKNRSIKTAVFISKDKSSNVHAFFNAKNTVAADRVR